MVISDYYQQLESRAEKTAFRDKVISRTGIGYTTFYDKVKGNSWSKAEIEVISNIIKENQDAY